MDKHTIEAAQFHALREELRKVRLAKQAVTINVEDAIFTRLIEAEELLAVAMGLFTELAENKNNWLFSHEDAISEARWALHNMIHERSYS